MEVFNQPVPQIVGPVVAGEAAKTRKQLEQLIKKVNSSAFDIAELLHKIKKNGYYEGFTTFQEYVRTLEIKPRKAQYLRRIAEVMDVMGIAREKYEPLGVAKLREITSLNMDDTWVNPETKEETPIKAFIQGFIDKGADMTLDEIKNHVKTLKGLVGEDAMGWLHLYMKQMAIDQVVRPALDLAKAQIGSVGKDDEGISKDASDGAAAEVVFVAFLNDPANGILAGKEHDETSLPDSESSVDAA
jgi:hypothetical protein